MIGVYLDELVDMIADVSILSPKSWPLQEIYTHFIGIGKLS